MTKLFFASVYFQFFTTGFFVILIGALLPEIISDFELSYDMAGMLLSLKAIGNVTALVVGGYLSDIFGRKAVLITAALMIGVGMTAVAITSVTILLYVMIFIAGCGWGIGNLANGVVSDKTNGSTSHLNRLHMNFAIGALIAPFFVIFTSGLGLSWRFAAGISGIFGIIAAVLILLGLNDISAKKELTDCSHTATPAFKQIRYYVFCGILFIYVAVETVMNGWITTYFQGTGILTRTEANIVLSLVWVSILIGRVIASLIGERVKKENLVFICTVIVLFAAFTLMRADSFIFVSLCAFIVGFGLSAICPTAIANAAKIIKGSGLAIGIMLASAGLGAAFGPAVTGAVAEYAGLGISMWVSVGFAAILFILAVVNIIFGKLKT